MATLRDEIYSKLQTFFDDLVDIVCENLEDTNLLLVENDYEEIFAKIKDKLEELFVGDDKEDSCTIAKSYYNNAICAALSVIDKIEKEYE